MDRARRTSSAPEEYVQSLERGLRVIRAFSAATPRLTLSEAARLTALTRATARRCLLTLVELGYAETDGRTFGLTPRTLDLGFAYLSSTHIGDLAEPYMEDLSVRVAESVSIAVLDGAEIVYVARVPVKRIMRIGLALGSRLPALATSMGRVLVADLPDRERAGLLRGTTLMPYTARTLTDPARLARTIEAVRRDGYAIVDRELEEGLRSIAAPIRDRRGRAVAAINVSTQPERVDKTRLLGEIRPALLATADRISDALAGRG